MLAIRMQRTGRKGHTQFRVIVQDARRSPTSGRLVAQLGHYNPHSKEVVIDKEKAAFYLEHGAQPSPRVTSLLRAEKVKLPGWVEKPAKKSRAIRNADKLRRNRPKGAKPVEVPAVEKPAVAVEAAPEVESPVQSTEAAAPEAEVVTTEETVVAVSEPEEPEAAPAEEATEATATDTEKTA